VSVLNQMLRDLESRGVAVEASAPPGAPPRAAPIVRALPRLHDGARKPSQWLRFTVWSSLALAIATTTAGYLWYAKQLHDSARAPQPLGARQFAGIATPPAPPSGAPAATPSNVAAGSATPAAAATAPPAGVPAAEPSNVAAGNAALDASAAPAAMTAAMPAPVESAGQMPAAAPATAADRVASAPAAARSAARAPTAAAAAAAATKPRAVDSVAAAAPAALEPSAPVVNRGNTGGTVETRVVELIARGRTAEAMSLLARVIEQAPSNGNARATLAALQAESGRRDLALQTLLAGSAIDPERFAMAAAKLQAEHGDAVAALATLERVAVAARTSAHHALAGGLAQRAGEHRRAVEAYRRALAELNAPAIWWAGLAISLDALEDRAAALDAFRRAAVDAGLPAASRRYVLARIGELEAAAAGDETLAATRR
jgi:tetratricopeptide (TPR) repeat protein